MDELSVRIERRLRRLADENVVTRIWHRDHTVWNPDPTEIADRLGWLDVAGKMHDRVGELLAFAAAVAEEGYEKVVLLGMGGSSLAPEVIRKTYGVAGGRPDLTVLDTTHPGAIARVRGSLDRDRTLFIVASKSGSTVETLSHCRYFLQEIKRGEHFVAITDPGSALENLARTEGFRAVFLNPSDIGGRYSALSLFGLLPGALIGADLRGMLERAEEMARACRGTEENPGAWLGVVMAEAALAGRDKLTLVLPSGIASFGGWVEQLIAESTGKDGTGILPVVGERLGDTGIYGDDRLFVSIGSEGGRLEAIEEAGQPVVRLAGGEPDDLPAEFMRWEFAAAVAGHVLGINPFDQPNVSEAKDATARVLAGHDPAPKPGDLTELIESVRPRDYLAIQAFLDPTGPAEDGLERVRETLRAHLGVAVTVGFGPRYLHSTGQLHKGGAQNGAFIQVVDDEPAAGVSIPGAPYSFGRLISAQADGDLVSLRSLGRRAVRVTHSRLLAYATGM